MMPPPTPNASTSGLQITNLSKTFPPDTHALVDINLQVKTREIVALLGPSGCGKSTLLNTIAGLEKPDQGEISWNGKNLVGSPSYQRGFGLMFQDYALFPHMNVADNIAFGLRMAKYPKEKLVQRVDEMLTLVDLLGFGPRNIATLSGGESQRVALARALAPSPHLLMLDEPLGALDRTLRERLIMDLRRTLRQLNQTAIYVTHDQQEAFALADRIILMHRGRIIQIGTPQEIYQNPASPFAARFLGMTNLIHGTISSSPTGRYINTPIGEFPLGASTQSFAAGAEATLLLRPNTIQVTDRESHTNMTATLVDCAFQGDRVRFTVLINETQLVFDLDSNTAPKLTTGDTLYLQFDPDKTFLIFPEK